MASLLKIVTVAAVLGMAAAPAYAQRINAGADGTAGRVTLATGYAPDPHDVGVSSGGPVAASSVSEGCTGFVASRPSVSLRYTAGDVLPLIVSATADVDTTLLVRAPDRSWHCNDDANGFNPAIEFDDPQSGRYQIWVGTYAQDASGAPAVLHISEIAASGAESAATPDPALDPAYGSVELVSGFQPDPHTIDISAGGDNDASALGDACVGWIATAPDYRVVWTAGSGALPLVFSVNADADTTLVINDASGAWICDDDGGNNGLNPAITIESPPSGVYDIWVGTFSEGALQKSTLNVSELYAQ